jgi:methyl-accepting chemotaxis protein
MKPFAHANFRRSTFSHWAMLLVCAGLALSVAGCGNKKKIAECRAVISSINVDIEKIHKRIGSTPQGAAAVRELESLASGMEDAAEHVAEVDLSFGELEQHVKDYRDMAGEVARAARELAGAVDKVDLERIDKAEAALKAAMKREEPIVAAISTFCQAP